MPEKIKGKYQKIILAGLGVLAVALILFIVRQTACSNNETENIGVEAVKEPAEGKNNSEDTSPSKNSDTKPQETDDNASETDTSGTGVFGEETEASGTGVSGEEAEASETDGSDDGTNPLGGETAGGGTNPSGGGAAGGQAGSLGSAGSNGPGNADAQTKPADTGSSSGQPDGNNKTTYKLVHPGVLHTEDSIEYMKQAVNSRLSPNYETYQALLSSPLSDPNWNPRAVETVVRGGNGDNVSKLYIDVARAYQCALIWRISGSEAHGKAACRILNGWSATLKTVTGNADRYLAAGLFGYQLANISELMRDHPDFKVQQMENMLLNVFYYPLNERFLTGNQYGKDHNDAYIGNYWANWDLCNLASATAIGIFCDNREIYRKAVKYYKSGLGNGSLYNAIPYVYDDGTAQWQESGRDQGHTNLGLGLMACICEMAWSQGDDLYGLSDNRLLKAAEYIAKYNNGGDVQFSEYEWGSGKNGTVNYHYVISASGRGEQRPIWSMIYNHYAGRLGMAAPNVKARLDAAKYEYGAVSGGHATTYDQPGWGTLTYAGNTKKNVSVSADKGEIADGVYRIVSVHTGKALAVNVDGALCQSTDADNTLTQWRLTYIGGGEYKAENVQTGGAMTVDGGSHANGGVIIAQKYEGAAGQRFAFLKNDEGNYRIIASVSGKSIDIRDWSSDDNAVIFQWRYLQGNNQKWYLERTDR